MTNKELLLIMRLRDEVSKKITTMQGRFAKFTHSFKRNWLANTVAITAGIVALKKFTDTIIVVQKELVTVSAKFERWQVQIRTFTKDAQEANQVLQDLIAFSVATPFTPEEVVQAGKLLKPLEELGFKMTDLLTASGNAATAFGLTMQESALQMVRSFTAGIGAADLFRDRGVRSFIEINEGIDLTKLNMDELRETLLKSLTSGSIGDAMKREAKTFEGLMSTLQGEWMIFKQAIGEDMFVAVKDDLEGILFFIRESKKEGGEYNKIVVLLGETFGDVYDVSKEFFVNGIVFSGQLVDITNEIIVVVRGAQAAWVAFIGGIMEMTLQLGNIPGIGSKIVDKEALEAALEEVGEDLLVFTEEINIAREKANVDYSTQLQKQIQMLRQAIKIQKDERLKAEKEITQFMTEEERKRIEVAAEAAKMRKEFNKEAISNMRETLETVATMNKEAAIALQVVRIGEAIINTHAGVTQALASYPPPYSFIMAALVAAKGAAEVASIAGVKFHEGGVVGGAGDEIPIIAQRGEGVLSRRGLSALGGESVLNRLNQGAPYNNRIASINNVDVRVEINNPVISNDEVADEFVELIAERISTAINNEAERI